MFLNLAYLDWNVRQNVLGVFQQVQDKQHKTRNYHFPELDPSKLIPFKHFQNLVHHKGNLLNAVRDVFSVIMVFDKYPIYLKKLKIIFA